jgi:hypothetical protein
VALLRDGSDLAKTIRSRFLHHPVAGVGHINLDFHLLADQRFRRTSDVNPQRRLRLGDGSQLLAVQGHRYPAPQLGRRPPSDCNRSAEIRRRRQDETSNP